MAPDSTTEGGSDGGLTAFRLNFLSFFFPLRRVDFGFRRPRFSTKKELRDGAEERGKLIRVWQSSLKRLRFQSFDKRFTSLAATAYVILCGPCLLLKRMTDVLHTSPLAYVSLRIK